jgi:hypothetical protein
LKSTLTDETHPNHPGDTKTQLTYGFIYSRQHSSVCYREHLGLTDIFLSFYVPFLCSLFRSVVLFRSLRCSLCVVSFIHWLSLFGVWSVCPFGIPGTTELIYLNPRNIPIPRYHRLSVGTGAHSHHDREGHTCQEA